LIPVTTAADLARAVVLVPFLQRRHAPRADPGRESIDHSPEERLVEAKGLAEAIDLDIVAASTVTVPSPKPATLFGSGKVAELAGLITNARAELAIVDHSISPVQQRNLEKAWNVKVLDRTGLILEIFGARARTREGRLQVELAHLSYQKGRLVRAWTHLERQRGGSGFLGGPGEAQIELDKRMIQSRMDAIRRELEHVVKTRELHRSGRRKVPYPVVAIVGYTNAGKSTLFNCITGAEVLAKDQVFATLDPTMREVRLASGRRVILSDTVGFISDLPTMLVAAFRATLEEVVAADLILHVRDISHHETDAQRADVLDVLSGLGISAAAEDAHILEVWNKIDLLSPVTRDEAITAAQWNEAEPICVSAITGEGIDQLLATIDARLGQDDAFLSLTLPASEGRLTAWLHDNAEVLEKSIGDDGAITMQVRIADEKRGRLLAQLQSRRLRVE